MLEVENYIIALSNLYGMVQKNKVYEIYNNQNEERIKLSDVDGLLKKPSKKLKSGFVRTQEDYFVHEAIYESDQFDIMLIKKRGKPYYIPKKEELLKYVDDNYFEETKEYKTLFQYVKKNFLKKDPEKVEWLCEEIYGTCQFGGGLKGSIEVFDTYGIIFDGIEQVNEVAELVIDLSNNIRIWENNGHTPSELSGFPKKSRQDSSTDYLMKLLEEDNKEREAFENIGRNDKCPCGSGKKFKMCCLKKYS